MNARPVSGCPRGMSSLGWKALIVGGVLAWWIGVRLLDEEAERARRPAAEEGQQDGEPPRSPGDGLQDSWQDEEAEGDEEDDDEEGEASLVGGSSGGGSSKSRRREALWTKVEEDFRWAVEQQGSDMMMTTTVGISQGWLHLSSVD